MEPRSSTAIRGISGDDDAASGDLELVAAAKGGSNAAFEELQSRYSRRLYRRIQFITRNHEDAEDTLQATFHFAYLPVALFGVSSRFACGGPRRGIISRRRGPPRCTSPPGTESEPLPD